MPKRKHLTGFWNDWWRILTFGVQGRTAVSRFTGRKKTARRVPKGGAHIKESPLHFWAVSPNHRLAFDVHYQGVGFRLSPVSDIPFHRDADLFSFVETIAS
jgi:hypothetical protein